MREESEKDVKSPCKHGISDPKTCGLCLGLPQTEAKESGPPAWLTEDLNNEDSEEDEE